MKTVLQTVQEKSLSLLSQFPLQERKLPDQFQQALKPEAQGELHLTNRFIRLDNIGEVRNVIITSPKINIFNMMFYPEAHRPLPCYAAEFVCLSDKPIVAVIDAKCLDGFSVGAQVGQLLVKARSSIDYRPEENSVSEWFDHCKSGFEILVRPKSSEEMLTLLQTHLTVWAGIAPLFDGPDLLDQRKSAYHQELIRHYKYQHAAHYPGIPLLNRCFGIEWTDNYINRYLFG